MKTDDNISQDNTIQNPPAYSYDLRLGQRKKVWVNLIDSNSMKTVEGDFKPTHTILQSLSGRTVSKKTVSNLDIGLDTEFVESSNLFSKDGKRVQNTNDVSYNYLISTQFYVHYTEWDLDELDSDGNNFEELMTPKVWSGMILHNSFRSDKEKLNKNDLLQNRITFSELIHIILQKGFEKKLLNNIPKNFYLLSHFNNAEFDKFLDLNLPQVEGEKELIHFLSTIRKSYSHHKTVKLITDKNRDDWNESVLRIYDTINLTPAKYKTLKDLGELLHKDNPKENLKKKELGMMKVFGKSVPTIEYMGELATKDFQTFYNYGIQDAKIPVFFIDKIRWIQRELFLQPFNDVEDEGLTYIRSYFTKFATQYQPKHTLTGIGSAYLRNVIWKNTEKSYSNEELKKVFEFYNPKKVWKKSVGLNWQNILGLTKGKEVIHTSKSTSRGGSVRAKPNHIDVWKPYQRLNTFLPLIRNTYYGGRNEQFFFGISPSHQTPICDYDLVSAYPTSMMGIGLINWRKRVPFDIKKIRDWKNYASYFEVISFKFPDTVKYPTIPVRNAKEDGIIFPLEGGNYGNGDDDAATFITGIEIDTAIRLGCDIELGEGVIFEMDRSVRPYLAFSRKTITERRKAEKDDNSVMVNFWKEMMNSLYGKTAQGISKKMTFDIREGKSKKLPPDMITCFPIASLITSTVRCVLGLMMNRIEERYPNTFIGNITTDGFATSFPNKEEDWKRICDDELILDWFDNRSLIEDRKINSILETTKVIDGVSSQCKNVIEKKHEVERYIGWRTRGQATLLIRLNSPSNANIQMTHHLDKDDESDWSVGFPINVEDSVMLARTNLRTSLKDNINSNLQTIWYFLNRFVGLKYSLNYIKSLRQQLKDSVDAVNIDTYRTVGMDFDLMRYPNFESVIEEEVEFIDVLDSMDYRHSSDSNDANSLFTYFTANFVDINQLSKSEVRKRKKKYTIPTFTTKPLKNLDEFEKIRKNWVDWKTFNKIENKEVDDEFFRETLLSHNIPYSDWNTLKEGISKNKDSGDICDGVYNDIIVRLKEHLNNDGIMNTALNINLFSNFLRSNYSPKFVGNRFNKKKDKDNKWDTKSLLIRGLCIAFKENVYGLGEKNVILSDNSKRTSFAKFVTYLYKLFYDDDSLRKVFKGLKKLNGEAFDKRLKTSASSRHDKEYSEFNNIIGEAEKWEKAYFFNTKEINNLLEELRDDIAPKLDIGVFVGEIPFDRDIELNRGNKEWDQIKKGRQYSKIKESFTGQWKQRLSDFNKYGETSDEEEKELETE